MEVDRERCVRRTVPWLTALVVLAVTVVAAIYVDRTTRTRDALAFEVGAGYAFALVERRLENFESILQGTSALFAASESVTTTEFDRFVRRLELASRHPGLRGIGYAERDGDRYVVRHLEPAGTRSPGRIGADLTEDPDRAEALRRAIASGQPAATGRVRFVDGTAERVGIVIYVPVYAGGDVPGTEQERRAAAAGVVFGRVAATDIVGGLFGGDSLLDVALYEGLEADPQHLVFAVGDDPDARHVVQRPIDVSGSPWTLVIRSTPAFERGWYAAVPLVFVVGALVASALYGLTRSIAAAHARLERIARDLRASEAAVRYSEERTRALIEQSPLAVQVFEPAGHSIAVNPAWEHLFGVDADEVTSRPILEDPQIVASGVMPLVQEAFAGRTHPLPPIRYAPRHGRFTGEERWIQAHVYPVLADGHVREVVAMYDDVTARRQIEDALRDAQRLESLGVMAGGIAHDFNNLLTGVLGYASLGLSEVGPDHPVRPMLEQIVAASERAADLTRQLLAYAGKGRYRVERLELEQVVREVRRLLVAVSPGASVDLDLEPGLAVDADSGQMHQLLLNVVLNAIESYGDERRGRVLVRARRVRLDVVRLARDFPGFDLDPGPHVWVEVVDRGEGMDTRTLGRSFDPFYTTRFMGRGLGLPAALGIVRGHHGGILVRSERGVGTRVAIVLPAATLAAEQPHEAPSVELYGHGRVLVVDDEAIVRDTARAMLEEYGYDVVEAANGGEALARIAEDAAIDVVLLDMSMPVLDGAEVLARIRALRPGLPVVASSGYDEEEALRRFAGIAADGFLQKPYRARALAARIARVLFRTHRPSPAGEHPPA